MPVPGFLSSFADKAQAAVNASPLAQHIPHGRPTSPGHEQPSANQAAAQGGTSFGGNSTFGALQHQLRAFGQQYTSATPVQKIITTEKGVAIDFDSISRDSKTQSKELYTWGQAEADDIKDVTDRLAYLNFVQGSLASSLAVKLDAARSSFKNLRDTETTLAPRRNIRAGIALQISRVEHDQQKGDEKRLDGLREQLRKAEAEDSDQEKQVEILKRKAVRESEQQKWDAIREYGEKLVLLSQAAAPITSALPALPPTKAEPYKGAQATAAARASLQRALDNYKTGHINLPSPTPASDLSRSDTRSFGESHASELSSMASTETLSTAPGLPLTPPSAHTALPTQSHPQAAHPPSAFKSSDSVPNRGTSQSPPMNTAVLNNAPAPIPIPTSPKAATTSPAPAAIPDPANLTTKLPAITPTVAETGVPVTAGDKGPGPASGSLHDIKAASTNAGPRSGGLPGRDSTGPGSTYGQTIGALGAGAAGVVGAGAINASASPAKYESAEDEKKRLQKEDRERLLASQSAGGAAPPSSAPPPASGSTPAYESADDEKKRLEREERERLLKQGGSGAPGAPGPKKDDEDLPPYQDM